MAIRGQLDGMEGGYVVGWAAAQPDTGNCLITLTEGDDDTVIAKGRASRHRPDLGSLGLGRTTFAFRIPLTHKAEPRLLHVLANGEELPGSPMLTGAGRFDGHCHIEAAAVAGWVTERVPDGAAPYMTIVNQFDAEVGRGPSAYDAKNLDALFTPARFSIELDDQVFGAGDMILTVLANGVPFAKQTCNLQLRGNLEIISATNCLGWMVAPDLPAREFAIQIYRDGLPAGTARTEHKREDVRGLFPDCGTPGFATEFEPARLPVTGSSTISLRFAGSSRELFDGPYVIASRPAAVLAAYRVARLANQELPGIGPAERAVLQLALSKYIATARTEQGFTLPKQVRAGHTNVLKPRLVVIIPIYRGVEVTQACINSVLAHRNVETDRLVLINDRSPEAEMAGMLASYTSRPNVTVLTNDSNLGFVKSVNRGLAVADGADVLLLNSDTVVFDGGFDEFVRLADAHPEIGTITALSNNATIFSYPHAELRREQIDDISWTEMAELALRENAGVFADVPTGHGFCMFIRGEVIRRIGVLDEAFGRGYGEENDFCARSATLGYRHVAAGGVLVVHKESLSFADERAGLLAQNLPRLEALYPEYTPIIMEFERTDGMRALRWALDRARLARAHQAGVAFVLLISNALEGGTAKAIIDFERAAGYGAAIKLSLRCNQDGLLELSCAAPLLLANFTATEVPELFSVLSAAAPTHVLAHQLLGFPASFIQGLAGWAKGRHRVFFAHDFYALCPRVTMIDAVGRFCDVADTGTCARCVEMGSAHETSRLTELTPAEHRQLFAELLGGFDHVLAPSENAAGYLRRGFPGLAIEALAHPESGTDVPAAPRAGSYEEIIMLGAIGPHKGSAMLLEIARRARLTHPHLHFRVIGYTNIDKPLRAIGNVTITGKFAPEDLPRLFAQSRGRLALFLSTWPETYSYTLSEIAKHGLIPLVPDIGAPAERVRAAEYGVVFAFPINPEALLQLIDDIAAGRVSPYAEGAGPARFFPGEAELRRAAEVLAVAPKEAEANESAAFLHPPARPDSDRAKRGHRDARSKKLLT